MKITKKIIYRSLQLPLSGLLIYFLYKAQHSHDSLISNIAILNIIFFTILQIIGNMIAIRSEKFDLMVTLYLILINILIMVLFNYY